MLQLLQNLLIINLKDYLVKHLKNVTKIYKILIWGFIGLKV